MLDPTIKHQPKNSFDLYDETRHGSWETTNSNLWPSKKHIEMDDEHEPRWSMNSPHYRSLSPVSRTEAIVRGQKELMEMVKNMPESNYELSLKDIVEHHHRIVSTREENSEEEEEEKNSNMYVGDKKIIKKTRSVKRNEKIDRGGFYLKVAFPFSLGSTEKKKKKNESKVSPRPSISEGFVKGADKEKEWWKKSSSVYHKQSDSAASSTNSTESTKSSTSSSSKSSNSTRSKRIRSNSIRRDQKGGGRCWPLFCKPKIQTKK